MGQEGFEQVELVVRTIAQTAVDNETYFCELDAVVGDGDFGYSLARGFEIVLADWDGLDRTRRRDLPEEGRGDHHQPHRRHLRPALGHGASCGPARAVERSEPRSAPTRRRGHAAGGHRGHQAARQVRRGRQDPARRARARPSTRSRSALRAGDDGATALAPGRGDGAGRRPRRPRPCSPSAAARPTPASAASGAADAGAIGGRGHARAARRRLAHELTEPTSHQPTTRGKVPR